MAVQKIKCGNRARHGADIVYHSTVDEVRRCYQEGRTCEGSIPETEPGLIAEQDEELAARAALDKMVGTKAMMPASDAQVRYVLGLIEERLLPDNYIVKSEMELRRMERPDVSAQINLLKTFPHKESNPDIRDEHSRWTMPEGRYALQDRDGIWRFYQVDKPVEGRWEGYVFVKWLVATGGTDYVKTSVRRSERERVLAAIEEDPKTAMIDFGLQSGSCGRCGRALSDPDSLAAGIGPICAGKGW